MNRTLFIALLATATQAIKIKDAPAHFNEPTWG